MRYVTGTYALNLHAPNDTPGDWHYSALNWDAVKTKESSDSVFKDWGLYQTLVPNHGTMYAANHLRACLDLLEDGYYSSAQGMREYFLADDSLTPIVFRKVWLLNKKAEWQKIDEFMGREYRCQWLGFKEKMNDQINRNMSK